MERAPLKSEPIIRITAGIETVLNAQVILIAPALLCDLNSLDFTWFPVRKIDVYQDIVRPASIHELADKPGA
jgi:hypothetical protein